MRVEPVPSNNSTFGYRHPLKRMWKQGQLPTVKYGLYGNPLTEDTVSLEHEKPASAGGLLSWGNIALATVDANTKRGNRPITEFLTPEMAKNYLSQFIDVVVKKGQHIIFKGNEYIKRQTKNLRKLGINI